eukprot:gene19398-biopygen2095
MSPVYRLWAAARLRDMIPWQERWIARGQKGYRPGHSCADVYYEIMLRVEEATLSGRPFGGMSYDYRKCFDLVPQDILLRLLDRMGLDPRIGGPMRAMYTGLRRQFKIGTSGAVGEPFFASNGVLQGCPVSVVALNALLSVWTRAVEAEAPGTHAVSYADDQWQTADGRTAADVERTLQQGNDVSAEHAELTGQEIHPTKTFAFLTKGSFASLHLRGRPVERKRSARGLGADIGFQQMLSKDKSLLAESRVLSAIEFVRRVQRVPMNAEVRAELLMAGAIPAGLYAAAITPYTQQQLRKLTQEIVDALCKRHKDKTKPRAPEMMFGLIWPGHRLDPQQVVVHECFRQFYWMGCRRRDLRPLVWRAFELQRDGRPDHVPGPLGRVQQCCEWLGWRWVEPCTFRDADGTVLRCLDISEERLMHRVREASRRRLLQEVAARRSNDFDGVQEGIDRLATMALYSLRRTSSYERAFLRSALIGAQLWSTAEFWARSVKDDAERALRGVCTFCSTPEYEGRPHAGEVETLEHLYWQCP